MVATPIGNLRDITLRALDLLASVDRIAAEDTRHTRVLLEAHGLAARMTALHRHNEVAAADRVVQWLREGASVALVTDAGTPGVSDPGTRVVRAAREAGFAVVPVPGASAVITALSASGIESDGFRFEGFLPAKGEARRARIRDLADCTQAVVLYEAPHRIRETLQDLQSLLGPDRGLTVCRELTKRFESIADLRAGGAVEWLDGDPNRSRGEFVLLVHPARRSGAGAELAEGLRILGPLLEELPASQAARLAAKISGARRGDLYDAALRNAGRTGPAGGPDE